MAKNLPTSDKSDMTDSLKARVEARLQILEINPFEAARRAGFERNFVNDIINGKKGRVLGDNLGKLADALETTPEFLTGRGERQPVTDQNPDRVVVNQLDVRFGMGGGAIYDLPVKATPLEFPKSWLRQFTSAQPSDIFWATGFGDSMYPTIGDSDVVLVDTSQKEALMRDKIWAINQYGQGMIKRLRATAEGYAILSDNPQVSPDEATDGSMEIVGRVVAVVRRL